MSRTASGVILSVVLSGVARADASPSVNGHWEITAATRPSRAAASRTWPPPNEDPHSTTRVGSIPSIVRAYAMADAQSSSWSPMSRSCRGSPPLAPKWR